MAPKKSPTRPATLATLAKLISNTAASADQKFAALAEDISDIKRTMATKDDLAALRTELKGDIAGVSEQGASIERELKAIRRDLADVTEKFENVSGFHKEIDHALERIAAIEKHLGLDKKIAASGLTSTSTHTIIIEAAVPPSAPPTPDYNASTNAPAASFSTAMAPTTAQ